MLLGLYLYEVMYFSVLQHVDVVQVKAELSFCFTDIILNDTDTAQTGHLTFSPSLTRLTSGPPELPYCKKTNKQTVNVNSVNIIKTII